MGTPRFNFETNCPDGQKCGATTTGCLVGQCQRSVRPISYPATLNLSDDAYVKRLELTVQQLRLELAALEADARRLDRLDSRADDWTYKNQKAWSFRGAAHLSLREALDAIDAALSKEPALPREGGRGMNKATPELVARLNNYLGNGGFWNPDLMEHEKVRDLILDVRDFLAADLIESLQKQQNELSGKTEQLDLIGTPI